MHKRFVGSEIGQQFLMPLDMREWVPADDLCWFIEETVENLDLAAIYDYYARELKGQPPYRPDLMVRVLLLGYCVGFTSSRQLERACRHDVRFRVVAANCQPDHSTVAAFRVTHRGVLEGLFLQVLHAAQSLGLVRGSRIVVDGTKMRANANMDETKAVKEWEKEEKKLEKEVKEWFDDAQEKDRTEDQEYGNENPIGRIPKELQDKQYRRKRIREVLDQLRKEAEEKGRALGPERLVNLTDPDSRRMREGFHKQRHGNPVQAYNCQAAADADSGIVVAAWISQDANDQKQLLPTARRVHANLGQDPDAIGADAGYYDHEQLANLPAGIAAYVPPPRVGSVHTGKGAQRKRMSMRMRSPTGKWFKAARGTKTEPIFGHLKHNRRTRIFHCRGKPMVSLEWNLHLTAFNLFRMWRRATHQNPKAAALVA